MSTDIITKNDLKNILNKTLSIQGADFVIESGISDIWKYQKWNSGIVECWGYTEVPSNAYTANGGYKQVTQALPSGLFITSPDIVIAKGRISNVVHTDMGFTSPNDANSIQTYLINRNTGAVTQAGRVYWTVKGRWKNGPITTSYTITSQDDWSGEGDYQALWDDHGHSWNCNTFNGTEITLHCYDNVKITNVFHSRYPNASWNYNQNATVSASISGNSILGTITYTYEEL